MLVADVDDLAGLCAQLRADTVPAARPPEHGGAWRQPQLHCSGGGGSLVPELFQSVSSERFRLKDPAASQRLPQLDARVSESV